MYVNKICEYYLNKYMYSSVYCHKIIFYYVRYIIMGVYVTLCIYRYIICNIILIK